MKKMKRLAALLLTILIFCTAGAAPASAEGFDFNWDIGDDNTEPHCKSLFLLNLDTDTVAYAMNADEPLPMASMTKIMSYIIAYENIPDIENTNITMPESVDEELMNTGSSVADMYPGETFNGLDMLYLMMVPSGNNAALTLAKYVDSIYPEEQAAVLSEAAANPTPAPTPTPTPDPDEDGGDEWDDGDGGGTHSGIDPTDYTGKSYFVKLMNDKARELGCEHTHFTNAHGLHNPNHFASARDMATITKYAMTLPNFTEITGTSAYNYRPVGSEEVRTANTTNKMLTNYVDETGMSYYYQFATGIKTGSLDEAGYCITASATAYGYTYIAVAMGSPMYYSDGGFCEIHGEMLDCATLFRWSLSSLEKKTVAVRGDVMSSVNLKYAWKKDELLLVAGENASVMLPSEVNSTSIMITPDIPESVEAPIRKGEQIGTATLSYAGETIATVSLVAAESVDRSEALHVWEQGQAVLSAPWFLVVMAVIVALVIVYIILILLYRRKQKQLRRVKRFRDI